MFLVTCLLVASLVSLARGTERRRLGSAPRVTSDVLDERGHGRRVRVEPYPFDFRGFYWLRHPPVHRIADEK
ncbi:hypothetical protein LSAT2_024193 [Lamellibrachia satsuma]|nr:hypothetical protein LSAT2_024193 [Lamellibrachia satsuma]